MKKPTLSIIVPCYNSEAYLADCFNSVLKQNYNDYEVICINDGSTDKTDKIIREFKNKFVSFKYIKVKHSGVSYCRNVGLERARGKYVLFLDSDDYLLDNALEKISKNIHKYSADVFISDFNLLCDDSSQELVTDTIQCFEIWDKDREEVLDVFAMKKLNFSLCRFIVSMELIRGNKILFMSGIVHEDDEWLTKVILKAKTFYKNDFAHFVYRRHAGSITTNKTAFNYNCMLKIASSLLDEFGREEDEVNKKFILQKVQRLVKQVYYNIENIDN